MTDPPELDLADIERALRERQTELRQRIAALARPPERGALLGFGKRIGDGTTEAISRITEVGVHSSLQESDRQIDLALAKLADGTYGTCDKCGRRIPPGRLRAVPQSTLCVDCARSQRR